MCRDRLCLQAAAGFKPIHHRHQHIQQDDIGRPTLRERDGLSARSRADNLKILVLQPGFEQLPIGQAVIHHQDPRCHAGVIL